MYIEGRRLKYVQLSFTNMMKVKPVLHVVQLMFFYINLRMCRLCSEMSVHWEKRRHNGWIYSTRSKRFCGFKLEHLQSRKEKERRRTMDKRSKVKPRHVWSAWADFLFASWPAESMTHWWRNHSKEYEADWKMSSSVCFQSEDPLITQFVSLGRHQRVYDRTNHQWWRMKLGSWFHCESDWENFTTFWDKSTLLYCFYLWELKYTTSPGLRQLMNKVMWLVNGHIFSYYLISALRRFDNLLLSHLTGNLLMQFSSFNFISFVILVKSNTFGC